MTKVPILFIMGFLLCSCNHPPKDVRIVLKAAGENRPELEKVIQHYSQDSADSSKLKAAYFLIGNMDNKFTIACDEIKKYDLIFSIFDSIEKNDTRPSYNSPLIKAKWDSLVDVLGPPSFLNAKIIPDYSSIKAEYLIENIDIAFKLREESAWGKKISFGTFCEYVLAYRFKNEPLERWRSYFYEKYRTKLDSINADSCYQLAGIMNKVIPVAIYYEKLKSYPYDIPNSKMVKVLKGGCPNIVVYNATAMRAIGLPVGIDYSPLYGNYSSGHKWNVLFLEKDKPLHFDRNKDTLAIAFLYKPAKVWRETFSKQKINIADTKADVPENLLNNHRIDVTHEYTGTCYINVELNYPSESKKRYAVICTFDNKSWIPQDFGRIKKGRALFKNMGTGLLYTAMYYDEGELSLASDPFIVDEKGNVNFFVPSKSKTQDMLLLRKFSFKKAYYCDDMINGYFEGSDKPDFSNPVKLFTITALPEKIETAAINNPLRFRYIRYVSPPPGLGNVAEFEFYGGVKKSDTLLLNGKIIGFPEVPAAIGTPYKNVFDHNLETFFDRFIGGISWVGLDLGVPKRITKIRYAPRSDTNFILIGDTYELCYWDNGEWISMGTQVAKDQFLFYRNVPSGALYILHNLTRGKEERIFTYENGKQVWW